MRITFPVWVMALLASIMAGPPAHATANYSYKKHEYPVIGGGRAPNHRSAITAHGEGEFGYDDFHLYLMAGRRIVRSLPAIGLDNTLDTDAKAFNAAWSPDSRRVIITYRRNRHILELQLYAVRGRHVRRIPVSDHVESSVKKSNADRNDLRARSIGVSWLSPTRFRLEQRSLYVVPSHSLADALGPFGRAEADPKQTPTMDSDGKPITWFKGTASLDLIYDVSRGSRPRLVSMKPGAFDGQ